MTSTEVTLSETFNSSNRRYIRPDPKFSKFNPEEEDEDSDDEPFEPEVSPKYFNGGGSAVPQHAANGGGGSRSSAASRQPPSYNRVAIKRRPRTSNPLGSLSNLTSVAETPPTPCAVSSRPHHQYVWPQQPTVLLSTPCGTICEEDASMPQASLTSTNLNYSEHLRRRRHSLHNQPQPLSVHGFGGYGMRRSTADLRSSSISPMMASDAAGFLNRQRSHSVMLRSTSSNYMEAGGGGHEVRTPAQQQFSSPDHTVIMDKNQVIVRPSRAVLHAANSPNGGLSNLRRGGPRVMIFYRMSLDVFGLTLKIT